ncbi:MAG: DUF3592 domain-containing protein [Bacilli bacterium]|jgi:hypothetical protein|nr:DUF3592 domain-containing protein [Bacilli bacterium]
MQVVSTKPMKPWQGILFGLIFVVIGIGLLLFSVSTIKNYNQKNKTYNETTSIVVDYAYNDEGLEAIIVEYTVDGKAYRKQSNSYSNMPKSKGTQVKVKYNPDDPSDAIWVNDSTNIVLPLVGGLFTLVGIIIVISSVKKMKNEKDAPTIQQSNGLYNSVDVVNTLQNNQNLGQQTSQFQQTVQLQVNQNGQVSQYQQPVANQNQDAFRQNSNYPNGQDQTNNQNNTNSNL